MGSSWAALRAGQKPKITPISAENRKATATDCGDTIAAHPAKVDMPKATAQPSRMPLNPPNRLIVTASVRNWT